MDYLEENKEQHTLLFALLDRITESEWNRPLPGGWTVGTMLCHLAFWDQMTLERLRSFRTTGQLAPVPDETTVEAINSAARLFAASIPVQDGVNLIRTISEEIDTYVAGLSETELGVLHSSGREFWYRRSVHRQHHLTKMT